MQQLQHTGERGASEEERVFLCHDHDKERLEALEAAGGRIVGWVGGCYRVLMKSEPRREQ